MNVNISAFLLERYRIGEVTGEEKIMIEEALKNNETLAVKLAELDKNDNEFFDRFPKEIFLPAQQKRLQLFAFPGLRRVPPVFWGFCAAALVIIVALPLLLLRNQSQVEFGDRMKGAMAGSSGASRIAASNSAELNVYIKGNSAGEEIKLTDRAGVSEGNTVQLMYRVSGDMQYGVIFSVDGRSVVTLHYPYNQRQSTQLVSGRNIPLDEAYKLDDAPDYEIFFFVTGNAPMNTSIILNTARRLALQIERNPDDALQIASAVFSDYEVNIFTLIKEQ